MSSKLFILRWRRGNGEMFDAHYQYDPGGPAKGKTFAQWVNRCIRAGQANNLTFVGRIVGSQIREPLWASGYRLIKRHEGQAVVEDAEGGHELYVLKDDYAGHVLEIRGKGYEFARSLAPVESVKLRRRWEGIDPDEDTAEGLDDVLPGAMVATPAHMRDTEGHPTIPELRPADARVVNLLEPPPEREPNEIAINTEALLIAHSLELTPEQHEEQLPELKARAKQRLMARQRAMTIDVPALNHPDIQTVPVLVRDMESGEMKVTHAYHDLHAPEGEIVTQHITEADEEHTLMVGHIAVRANDEVSRIDTFKAIMALVRAGQIWNWELIEREVKARLTSPNLGAKQDSVEAVCGAMAREQQNDPVGWGAELPFVHLFNPSVDEFMFCGLAPTKTEDWLGSEEREVRLLWILPIRFIQCGPVPFGPMCPGCITTLEGMQPGDVRLVAPEELPGLVDEDEYNADRADEFLRPEQERYDILAPERPGWEEEQDEIAAGGSDWADHGNANPIEDLQAMERLYHERVAQEWGGGGVTHVTPGEARVLEAMGHKVAPPEPEELPKFFECGGCEHLHPFGWAGDCRDDSMRYAAAALDERYNGPDGWVEVDEITGEVGYETEPDPYHDHDEN